MDASTVLTCCLELAQDQAQKPPPAGGGCILASLLGGLIGCLLGSRKGRGLAGFWWGFFLGLVGWFIVMAVLEPDPDFKAFRNPPAPRNCPRCGGLIPAAVLRCNRCKGRGGRSPGARPIAPP